MTFSGVLYKGFIEMHGIEEKNEVNREQGNELD